MKIVVDGQVINIEPGQSFMSGGKVYAICPNCGKLVQLNKPLLGGLHFCE